MPSSWLALVCQINGGGGGGARGGGGGEGGGGGGGQRGVGRWKRVSG